MQVLHGRSYSGKLLLSCQTELRLASAESLYWSLLAHFVSSSRAKTAKLLRRTKSFSNLYRRMVFFLFSSKLFFVILSLVSMLTIKFCYVRKVSHYRKRNISLRFTSICWHCGSFPTISVLLRNSTDNTKMSFFESQDGSYTSSYF